MNILLRLFGRTYRAPDEDGEGGESRPSPAQINQEGNNARLRRMEQIANTADGRRAPDLDDVEGENATGRFQGGELDDSPEARERRAELADEDAAQALEENERTAAEEETRARAEAARLQAEGGGEGDEGAGDESDEKMVNGVRYFRTIVAGSEKWLTARQVRALGEEAEQALQRATEALQRASTVALSPKDEPAELDETELENVILSANLGDTEAVKTLASLLKKRTGGPPLGEISRQVAQQIATQRAIDSAEAEQRDLLTNQTLAPIFKQRLTQFAREKPETKIGDAYKAVGTEMRRDFAPMLSQRQAAPNLSKQDRKRTIVSPPQGAGRQPAREEEDREVPVSAQIDEIAKSRGQARAIRQGRR